MEISLLEIGVQLICYILVNKECNPIFVFGFNYAVPQCVSFSYHSVCPSCTTVCVLLVPQCVSFLYHSVSFFCCCISRTCPSDFSLRISHRCLVSSGVSSSTIVRELVLLLQFGG